MIWRLLRVGNILLRKTDVQRPLNNVVISQESVWGGISEDTEREPSMPRRKDG